MATWSVMIVAGGFQPDLKDAQLGQPLGVSAGDNVTWNNTTNDATWPWPTDANGNPFPNPIPNPPPPGAYYLSDIIPPGSASSPTFHVPNGLTKGATISYCDYLDQNLKGSIVVV